jgi:hypothetical protein
MPSGAHFATSKKDKQLNFMVLYVIKEQLSILCGAKRLEIEKQSVSGPASSTRQL